jgi:SNF2 family DNA or RNA helicase
MKAEITTDGKRILARIPWEGGQGPVVAKRIPGARWHAESKTWRYPLEMSVCYRFREEFGDGLRVGAPLSAWAREEIGRMERLEDIRSGFSHRDFPNLARNAPALYDAISNRGYQLNGTEFILTGNGTILGDQPGLGKTVQTLASLVEKGCKRILVSCPKTAMVSVWVRETNRWAPKIMPWAAQGNRQQREDTFKSFDYMPYDGPKMMIINTEMIRAKKQEVCPKWKTEVQHCREVGVDPTHKHKTLTIPDWPWLFSKEWDAIVLDESHNLLASTKNVQSKSITQARLGAVRLRKCLAPGGIALACSGTPFRSNLKKSWGTLNWLRPDLFTSYWRFAEEHFGVTEGQWGKSVGTEINGKFVAIPLDQEKFDAALRPFYLARTKAQVAPDLPPIQYAGTPSLNDPNGENAIWLDLDPKQKAAYDRMVKLAEVDVDGGRILANGVLAELTRLRQLCGAWAMKTGPAHMSPALPSSKIDWILEHLQETEAKVVIASSFTEMVDLTAAVIKDRLGLKVLTLTGDTKDRDRAEHQELFQNDPDYRVFVLNSAAGGEAITLDAADDMVFIDLPWTSDQIEQVESRIHRISRIHNVTVYRLLIANTVDEWIFGLTDEQKAIISAAKPQALSMLREAIS